MAKISTNAEINSVRLKEQASAPDTPASGYGQLYCKSDGIYFKGDDGVEIGPLAATTPGYSEGARVYNSADQSIPNAEFTALAFNSERYDTDTIHDNSTNNTRLTCKTAGVYIIIGQVQFESNATGDRGVRIMLNGTNQLALVWQAAATTGNKYFIAQTLFTLEVNDYVELFVYQSSGGALNSVKSVSGYGSPEFMMQRIS